MSREKVCAEKRFVWIHHKLSHRHILQIFLVGLVNRQLYYHQDGRLRLNTIITDIMSISNQTSAHAHYNCFSGDNV